MAYVIPNEGEIHIMSAAFQASGNFEVRLFSGTPTLTGTMTVTALAGYELTAGGYAAKALAASAWCIPFTSANSATVSASGGDAAGLKFTFTAAPNQSAHGYWIENAANKLIVVESFTDGPYYLSNAGDTVTVTPYVKLVSQSNP